jgi:hypothetical protein
MIGYHAHEASMPLLAAEGNVRRSISQPRNACVLLRRLGA